MRTVSIPVAQGIGAALLATAMAGSWVAVEWSTEAQEIVDAVQWRPALVKIPAGTFWMGSPEAEVGRAADEQRHEVTLTHDFYICQTEVTQAQWTAVMGENPSNYGYGDDVAVHNVSWTMAVEYLNELSKLEGLDACYAKDGEGWVWERSCDGYRLPTEAEWEYAARADTTTPYGFGDGETLEDYAWYDENSGSVAHVVAQKNPNDWELYDVHGNVREWGWDWYESDYGSQAKSDPVGPKTGMGRVSRGGAFDISARGLRSAFRSDFSPDIDYPLSGLRCVRGPHPSGRGAP